MTTKYLVRMLDYTNKENIEVYLTPTKEIRFDVIAVTFYKNGAYDARPADYDYHNGWYDYEPPIELTVEQLDLALKIAESELLKEIKIDVKKNIVDDLVKLKIDDLIFYK
jgi:hypothetical protein